MTKHLGIFLLALLIMLALLASTVMYQVDETRDIVLIRTFNKITGRPLMGSADAGLKFKWPWPIQKIERFDSRLAILEDPYQELPTQDNFNVVLNMYCVWRISDPVMFRTNVQTVEKAQQNLRDSLQAFKKTLVAKYKMSQLVNTDPDKMQIRQIEQGILAGLQQQQAQGNWGIEVTRVGLKVMTLNRDASQAAIENQIKERQAQAEAWRARGNSVATSIKAQADADSKVILAYADRKAENIRSEGRRDAAKYYETFRQNERLSMFLRALESVPKELQSRSVIILDSSQNPALEFFHAHPNLDAMKVPQVVPDKPKTPSPTTGPAEAVKPWNN